jgi:hypothetical protein
MSPAHPVVPPCVPRISAVVPTSRQPALLDRCLTALRRQHLSPQEYEIVVVDQAGDPETAACVGQHATEGPVSIRYVICADRRGPAAARNAGWRAAQAAILAFTNDDCIPEPGWLAGGLAAFEDRVWGAQGRLVMPLPARPTDAERSAAGLAQAEFATANCFYRREALEEAGGFDERFTAAWRDDSDVYFTLLERGHQLVRADCARVVHPIRRAGWAASLRQARNHVFEPLLRAPPARRLARPAARRRDAPDLRAAAAVVPGMAAAGRGPIPRRRARDASRPAVPVRAARGRRMAGRARVVRLGARARRHPTATVRRRHRPPATSPMTHLTLEAPRIEGAP